MPVIFGIVQVPQRMIVEGPASGLVLLINEHNEVSHWMIAEWTVFVETVPYSVLYPIVCCVLGKFLVS